MFLTTDEKSYKQLLLGDRTIQILGICDGDNVPIPGEIIYYNDSQVQMVVRQIQEIWSVQRLHDPEFLAHVIFDDNYYAAIEAQWKPGTTCRIYALLVAVYDETVVTFRDETVLSIGRFDEHYIKPTAKCQCSEHIGVLSLQIRKYHPELSSEEVLNLTYGIWNGEYFAYMLYLPVAYGGDLLLGYVIYDCMGNIISEAQTDCIRGRTTPELLNECRFICDEQGNYTDEAKVTVARHLRLRVYYTTGYDTTGVLSVN